MGRSGGHTVDEGLSTWELVNASQSDEEDLYSYESDDVTSDGDVVTSGSDDVIEYKSEPNPVREKAFDDDCIISIQVLSVSPPTTSTVEVTRNFVQADIAEEYDGDLRDVYNDGDDKYDYGVDDELVPWELKDKYGKQRIKKMGKKCRPKLNKSKRLPYYDNRPGFSYGKVRGCC